MSLFSAPSADPGTPGTCHWRELAAWLCPSKDTAVSPRNLGTSRWGENGCREKRPWTTYWLDDVGAYLVLIRATVIVDRTEHVIG